jgi:hypothetical protein
VHNRRSHLCASLVSSESERERERERERVTEREWTTQCTCLRTEVVCFASKLNLAAVVANKKIH